MRETQTTDEQLHAGTKFQKREDQTAKMQERKMNHAGNRRRMMKRRAASDDFSDGEIENILKDYANFLSCAPLQLFNLKPGDDGIVSAKLKDLANYSQVYIVAVDPDSVTQMSVSVSQILA